MAYDFTNEDSLLPSAPLPLVNDAVRRTFERVPREKLVLGISKQANQWVSGKLLPNHPLIADVEGRIADPAAQITWQMPYFLKEIVYNGESGTNDIFYEDTDSIAKKVWLARYYGLKGVSLWYMGNYTSADWELIHQEMSK
jgi:spore germination protein YaaH